MTENKRFKETISTGIVTDMITGEEYNCEYRINDELLELINKIAEENKELNQVLTIYYKIANCRNCDYHDYDCREDGDDFEICTKGKDMEDGICEDWREL